MKDFKNDSTDALSRFGRDKRVRTATAATERVERGPRKKAESQKRKWVLRIIALFISGYGVYALMKRQFIDYMFLKTQFVFFDFGEPLLLFFIDYLAIMGLFVCLGYYISKCLDRFSKKTTKVSMQGK